MSPSESARVALLQVRSRSWSWHRRTRQLALRLAPRPIVLTLTLVTCNLLLAACFVATGLVLFDDKAELFRELMPATWISFAQLGFIAVVAYEVHRRHPRAPLRESFFGLSTVGFAVLAFEEITQTTIFLAHFLRDSLGVQWTGGFKDLQALLLTLLLLGVALALLPRALVLRRHPLALALLLIGAIFGAASQVLDSSVPATQWVFVGEETLKLVAGAFLVGGFLAALRDVTGDGWPRSGPSSA